MFPRPTHRLLTPLERIQIGPCHTHILLTGNCLWNRGLGAYLLLSIFISPLCWPCNAGFTFLRRPCSSTDRFQGRRENGKTFPAAVAARGMADSTKTLVTSESSEQASLSGLGQKCSSCLQFKQLNSVSTSPLEKKYVFKQGHCTKGSPPLTRPLIHHLLHFRASRISPRSSLEVTPMAIVFYSNSSCKEHRQFKVVLVAP